jgi:hypothetical protein
MTIRLERNNDNAAIAAQVSPVMLAIARKGAKFE